MAWETFGVRYLSEAAKAIKDANDFNNALNRLDKTLDRVIPKVKQVGQNTQAITGAATRVNTLNANLVNTATNANAAAAALNGVGTAAGTIPPAATRATRASSGLSASFAGFSVGALTLMEVRKAAAALGEALKNARQYAIDTAEANIKLRDTMRELTAMGGRTATIDKTTDALVLQMLATRATAEEAREFNVMWESALPAAREAVDDKGQKTWGLNDKQEAELKEKVLQLAVAKGVKPDMMAKVIAGMGIVQPVTGVDQAMGEADMMITQGTSAVGKYAEIFKAAKKLQSQFIRPGGGGATTSEGGLFGLIGAATTVHSTVPMAATAMNQIWRESNKKEGEAIGITSDMSYVQRLEKFKEVIDKGKAAGRNPQQALREAGFKLGAANTAIEAETRSIEEFRRREGAGLKSGDPRAVAADVAKWQAENPERLAANQQFAADYAKGEAERALVAARGSAMARLHTDHQMDTAGSNFRQAAKDLFGVATFFGAVPARERELDTDIRKKILEADPSLVTKYPDLEMDSAGTMMRPARLAQILNEVSPEVRQQVGAAPQVEAAIRDLNAPGKRPSTGGIPAGIRPAGGAAAGGFGVPAGGGGPQASLDAQQFDQAVDKFGDIINRIGGRAAAGRAGGGGGMASAGPLPDFRNNGGPVRSGTA